MKTNKILPKDIYLLIVEKQNDIDAINMLTNKKYYEYYEQIFKKKHSYLAKYKKKNETWRLFYIRMNFYLESLRKLNIPMLTELTYVGSPSFDPIYIHKYGINNKILDYIDRCIGETQNKRLINKFICQGTCTGILNGIMKAGNLQLFKDYHRTSRTFDYNSSFPFIESSIISQNSNIIKYIFDMIPNPNRGIILTEAITGSIIAGNVLSYQYYINKNREIPNFVGGNAHNSYFFSKAFQSKNLNMINYFIHYHDISQEEIQTEFIKLVRYGHTDNDLLILQYLFDLLEDKEDLKERLLESHTNFIKPIDKDIKNYLIFVDVI